MNSDNLEAMIKLGARLVLITLACLFVIGIAVSMKKHNLENVDGVSSNGLAIQSDAFTKAELIGKTDCPMLSKPIPDWVETLARSAKLEPVSGSFYPGTQGLVGSADGTALITLHSREKQSVRMHDLRSYRILNNLELDINAAGVTRLDGDAHGTPMFILTNYDQPTVTLIDANLTSVRTLKLPNVFQNLVGIAMIQGDFAVLPSRSHRVLGFLSAGEVPSLQIVPVELDDDIFSSSAIPYGVAVVRGCIVLNYREDRKLAVGRLSAMGVIITKVFDTDLDHPQSMAVNNERLYVLETGSHSLLVYDFVSHRRHRILLPKGAFRGMTVTQSGEVFVSGQKFGEAEKNNTNFNSVLDENKVGIYKVLGTRRLTHTLVHQTPVPER